MTGSADAGGRAELVECRRYMVSGRVQGVWFRASTRDRARGLGLTGHAVNLSDGRVEVLACGPAAALDALQTWLHRGPPLAKVTAVACEPVDAEPPAGFTTR